MRKRLGLGEIGYWPIGVGFAATVSIAVLVLLDPFGIVSIARERAFDLLYSGFPRQRGTPKVLVVDIDDACLMRLGSWPLPRTVVAGLVEALAGAKPAAVAFDVFFAAADRHSPRALVRELTALPGGERAQPLVAEMPDTDARFAETLGNVPSVLGVLAASGGQTVEFNPIHLIGRIDGMSASWIDGESGPYRPLAEAALGLGVQSLFGEEAGIVRRVPLLLSTERLVVPGLALEAARIATGAAMLDVNATAHTARVGSRVIPLVEGGTMRLHWSLASAWRDRTVSALDVIDGKVAADRITKTVVLIGSSAPQAGALRPTAVSPLTPSVQVQAEAVEQLLTGYVPHRPESAGLIEFAATLLLGLVSSWLAPVRSPLVASLAQLALICFWILMVVATFLASGLLFDSVGPGIAIVVAGNVAAATAFARTRRLKFLISQRFEQYLAPDLVRAIVARPHRLKREGETREVTALFTDIEGFTALLTRIGPKHLIALLDPYFDGVCRVITEHGGMIDLIVGDAVHAFFNMPLDLPNHADRALDCALAITRFSDSFRRRPEANGAGFGRTRIGIETGAAIVGDVGGPRRLNYTAHGPVANAAARLEAANKDFGSTVCIGPGTAAAVGQQRLVKIGRTALRGFDSPVDVYTIDDPTLIPPTPEPRESGPEPRPSPASAPLRET